MNSLVMIGADVHDEALRYVYAFGGISLLRAVGAVAFLAGVACCTVRLMFALARRDIAGGTGASACARP